MKPQIRSLIEKDWLTIMTASAKSSAVHAITTHINTNGPAYPAKHPAELLDALTYNILYAIL